MVFFLFFCIRCHTELIKKLTQISKSRQTGPIISVPGQGLMERQLRPRSKHNGGEGCWSSRVLRHLHYGGEYFVNICWVISVDLLEHIPYAPRITDLLPSESQKRMTIIYPQAENHRWVVDRLLKLINPSNPFLFMEVFIRILLITPL